MESSLKILIESFVSPNMLQSSKRTHIVQLSIEYDIYIFKKKYSWAAFTR